MKIFRRGPAKPKAGHATSQSVMIADPSAFTNDSNLFAAAGMENLPAMSYNAKG